MNNRSASDIVPPLQLRMNSWTEQFFDHSFIDWSQSRDKHLAARQEVKDICQNWGLSRGMRLLDAGCGYGRHSASFAEQGIQVLGIDSSPDLIKAARIAAPTAEFACRDIREPLHRVFDFIASLWTSLGYFKTKHEDLVVFDNWFQSLRRGGDLIIETSDLEKTRFEAGIAESDSTPISVERKTVSGMAERTTYDWVGRRKWTVFGEGPNQKFAFRHIYEKGELADMLSSIGFVDISMYGGFRKQVKTARDRLVLHAKRP